MPEFLLEGQNRPSAGVRISPPSTVARNKMPNAASNHNGNVMIATELRPHRGAFRRGLQIVPGAGHGTPPKEIWRSTPLWTRQWGETFENAGKCGENVILLPLIAP